MSNVDNTESVQKFFDKVNDYVAKTGDKVSLSLFEKQDVPLVLAGMYAQQVDKLVELATFYASNQTKISAQKFFDEWEKSSIKLATYIKCNYPGIFEKAIQIKNERGTNYDNGGRSAYELAIDMYRIYDNNNGLLGGVWPLVQKTSRLVTIAKNSTFNESSWFDTSIDLLNYDAMQYSRFYDDLKAAADIEATSNFKDTASKFTSNDSNLKKEA